LSLTIKDDLPFWPHSFAYDRQADTHFCLGLPGFITQQSLVLGFNVQRLRHKKSKGKLFQILLQRLKPVEYPANNWHDKSHSRCAQI